MKKILLTALLLAIPFNIAQAKEIDKPIYVYGESMQMLEKSRTRNILKVSDDAEEMPVFTRELNDLLHDNIEYNQVYSSSYIEPREEDGVSVEIVTPENITEKTESQYTNAAITAGANKVNIKIASIGPVDGSGALAGLYKALELDPTNVKVAQDELNLVSSIKGNSDDQLMAAITNMKKDTIDLKKGKSPYKTTSEIVDENVKVYKLKISQENKGNLKKLLDEFMKIDLTKEQEDSLTELINKLLDKGGNYVEDAKNHLGGNLSPKEKEEMKGIWQNIINFFKNLFDRR